MMLQDKTAKISSSLYVGIIIGGSRNFSDYHLTVLLEYIDHFQGILGIAQLAWHSNEFIAVLLYQYLPWL